MDGSVAVVGVVLEDGSRHSWRASELPATVGARTWKSWAMRELPYGTSFFGCQWFVERGDDALVAETLAQYEDAGR